MNKHLYRLGAVKLAGLASVLALFTATASTAQAVPILLNFGATISDDTNSAMHQDGGVTGTNWNLITTQDVSEGIVTADGAATDVSVTLGTGSISDGVGTLNWSNQPGSAAALGSRLNEGIYAGNGRSATYTGSGEVGVRISGLAAGTYQVYFSGRNTNAPGAQSHRYFYETVDATSGNTSYTTANSFVITYPDSEPQNWEENVTYGLLEYTIDDGEDIVLIVSNRGFIATVGIIPEPASAALLGMGGMVLMLRRRRR